MPSEPGADVVTKHSALSVADLVARLTRLVSEKGMKVFDVIDQRAEARRVGLDLPETVLVIFGSPAAGTPLMAAVPLVGLDLPLKVLVWDDHGQTTLAYEAPAAIARRHGLTPDLAARIGGVDGLTDAATAPGT